MANCYLDLLSAATILPTDTIEIQTYGDCTATVDETTIDIDLIHSTGLTYSVMVNQVWQTGFNGTITGPIRGGCDQYTWEISTHPDLLVGTWTLQLHGTCVGGTWIPTSKQVTFDVYCDAPVVINKTPEGVTTEEPSKIGCLITDDYGMDMSRLRLDIVSPTGVIYRAIDGGHFMSGYGGLLIKEGDYYPTRLEIQLKEWPDDIGSGQLWTFKIYGQNILMKTLGETIFPVAWSMNFDGVGDCIDFGLIAECEFAHTDPFSISVWYKTDGADVYSLVSNQESEYGRGYHVELDLNGASDYIFVYLINTWGANLIIRNAAFAKGVLNDGEWHNIVVTYDGSVAAAGVDIYWDGDAQVCGTSANSLAATITNTGSFQISGIYPYTSNKRVMYGNIKDVSVWAQQLSAAEVSEICDPEVPIANQDPTDLFDHSANDTLVKWVRIGEGDYAPWVIDYSLWHNHGYMWYMDDTDIVEDVP